MSKPVFISYAKDDKNWAEQVCAQLEEAGIGCWIAPRDIAPGVTWPAAITEAIRQCRAMIIIFSTHANQSPHMAREVEVADSRHVPIIPVRVEEVMPAGDMEYFLGNRQWFDLQRGMLERRITGLPEAISALIAGSDGAAAVAVTARRGRSTGSGRCWAYAVVAAVIVVAVILVFAWPTRPKPPTPSAQVAQAAAPSPPDATSKAPATPAKSIEIGSANSMGVKARMRALEHSSAAQAPSPAAIAKVDPPSPAVAPATDGQSEFSGRWQAEVKYSWGDSHTEVFSFKVDQNEVYGTASYVGGARGIQDGKIEGNRISFTTKSATMLGDKTYEEKHVYKGHMRGETIEFILQTESGYDSRAPEMFTASRAASSKP